MKRLLPYLLFIALLQACHTVRPAAVTQSDTIRQVHPIVLPFDTTLHLQWGPLSFIAPVTVTDGKANMKDTTVSDGHTDVTIGITNGQLNATVLTHDTDVHLTGNAPAKDTTTTITNTVTHTVTKTKTSVWTWIITGAALVLFVLVIVLYKLKW